MNESILLEIENYIYQDNLTHPKVSTKSIYWHLDHIIRATTRSCNAIIYSEALGYSPKVNLWKVIFFGLNWIPRGFAKAPQKIMGKELKINQESLKTDFRILKESLTEIENEIIQGYMKHPYFGDLNKKEALYFFDLHAVHHLKIVREIRKR